MGGALKNHAGRIYYLAADHRFRTPAFTILLLLVSILEIVLKNIKGFNT